MWMMLTIGNAILMVIYIREYYSRFYGFGKLDIDPNAIYPDYFPFISREMQLIVYDFFVPRTFRIQFYT